MTPASQVHDVFISYSRKDKAFARRLDKALRDYRPPRDLPVPQRHVQVFLDEEDFTGVEYRESVGRHLKASAKLIVLCSPHARQSAFVDDEIRRFAQLNAVRNIIPILISGLPNNEAGSARQDQMAFPPALCELMEIPLAVDFRGLDPAKDKVTAGAFHGAWFSTLANLYDQSRDQIEQREQKREARRRRITGSIVGAIMAVLLAALLVTLVFWRRAVEQRTIAVARQLAVQAELVRNQRVDFVETSLLIATESMKRAPSLEADLVLRPSLALLAHPASSMSHGREVSDTAFSADRTQAATGVFETVIVWDVATGREIRRLPPPDPVVTLAFSPDGRYLATGSGAIGVYPARPQNNATVIWDLETGLEVGRMQHEDVVQEVAFSTDGKRLAAFDSKNVQLLRAPTGPQQAPLRHRRTVLAMAFSPKAPILVTSTNDGYVHVWNIDTGREETPIPNESLATGISFSRDGQQLALTGNVTRILDAASGRELSRARHPSGSELAFSPDGEVLAAISGSTAVLSDTATGREISSLSHAASVKDLCFSPDGAYVATASDDDTVRIWTVAGREVSRLVESFALFVAFTPDGSGLLTANRDGRIRRWRTTEGRELAQMSLESAAGLALSADGRYLATGDGDGTVHIRETSTGHEVARISNEGEVRGLAFSPKDGKHLGIAIGDEIRIVESKTGRGVARLSDAGFVTGFLFTPDGARVAASSGDNQVRLWDVSSGRPLPSLSHGDGVATMTFSPDGTRLASSTINTNKVFMWNADAGGRPLWEKSYEGDHVTVAFDPSGTRLAAVVVPSGTTHVWNAGTGQELPTPVPAGEVASATFSRNGRFLVRTTSDQSVSVWAVEDGSEVARLPHEDQVIGVSLSADGNLIGTASAREARIWDAATGRERARLSHQERVIGLAFSDDGRYVTTVSNDAIARAWYLRPEDLVAEACARLTRNLTRDEWQRFVGDEPYRSTCPNLPAGERGR